MKDSSLTRYIAPFKKSLEVMVYRVRGMMAFNKCIGAFWIGHLKTKDLQVESSVRLKCKFVRTDKLNFGDF